MVKTVIRRMEILAATDVVFVFIFLPVSLLTLAFRPKLQKYVLLFLSLFYYIDSRNL